MRMTLVLSLVLIVPSFALAQKRPDPTTNPMTNPMTNPIHWRQLPPIPDPEGFATPFAGTSGGALIVAGGANFPGKRPWEGGTKVWYDSIFVLPGPQAKWKTGFHLPRPSAYGVSITMPDGLICIGGGNATENFRDVFRLAWEREQIVTTPLRDLPAPCAFMCGARIDQTIFIIGGIETPGATTCLKTFWALNLAEPNLHWRQLEACPGPERILGVAGAANGCFYLFSGARLTAGPDGKPVREYLRDAWRFTPGGAGHGWTRLADLPRAAVAAPSPAPLLAGTRLLVISGDDGLNIRFKPETKHPGFPHGILAYDTVANTWTDLPDAPFSRGTVPATQWGDLVVIPCGEARPGYRSTEVWAFELNHHAQ